MRTFLLAALGVALAFPLPCNAQGRLLQGDYGYDVLHLESHGPVLTWEEGGVRVFVARQGAVIRQGPARLSAPNMVVWFDKATSARPEVRAATVRVYAEGVPAGPGQPRMPVHLVEEQATRQAGAVFMRFTSTLAFSWNCPLKRSDKPVPSLLLDRAQTTTRDLQEDMLWEQMPPAGPRERVEAVQRMFSAEEVQVFWQEDPISVVYIGDVRGGYENLELHSDAAVLWYDRQRNAYEIYARGNVRITRRPEAPVPQPLAPGKKPAIGDVLEFMSADEVYINPYLDRGLATNPEIRMKDPQAPLGAAYVFRGDKAYMVDSRTLIVTEASFTTCEFARPHFQLKADRVQLMREQESTILSAWDVRFQVGRLARTLFRVPFIGTDLTRRAYLLADYAFGTSTKLGTFLQTTWTPADLTGAPEWVKNWTVNLDYYGARGPAIGTELEYDSGGGYPRHSGRLRAYFVSDAGTVDDTGQMVPQGNRGRFHLEHRTQLNRDWRVDAEYYWLSDSAFLNEFVEADFKNDKTPETYLLARYLRNSTYLALLYKVQTNSFITTLAEKPSLDLEIIALPLGRLLYDGSVVAGLYDLQINDELTPLPADPPAVSRLHTEHKLSLPFSVGIFRFSPFVRALATYASQGAVPGGTASRSGFGAGIAASTSFSRTYALTSERFDLNRLRHVVIPYAGVETLSVSGSSANFIQMDDRDTIDSGSQVMLGVRQRLETKRLKGEVWQPVDWMVLDVALVSRASDSVNTALDQDFMRADFAMQLTEHVQVYSHDNRLALQDQPSTLNVGAFLDYLPRWALRADYDYITDHSSTLSLDLVYKLSDRYQLLVLEQYELNSQGTGDKTSLQTAFVLRRLLHEWLLDLGLRVDKANGDFALILGFGPAGWGVFKDPRRAGRGALQDAQWAGP